MFPVWFHYLSLAALACGVACALIVLIDVLRFRQKMAVMNVVWPATALFGGVLTAAAYFRYGRTSAKNYRAAHRVAGKTATAFPIMVAKGTLHCGAGCTIGDIVAESLAYLVPSILVAFGWPGVFADQIFATWTFDFVLAFALGIGFQYFAIVPMRGLAPVAGIVAAIKADALSLISWQLGMYGFMAYAQWIWLPAAFGKRAEVNSPEFWFVMQLAMICGFVTAYPVNWWLIRKGVKEKM